MIKSLKFKRILYKTNNLMNKILLTIILITHTNNLIPHKSFEGFALTQKESEFLRSLNESYLNNKLFFKKMSDDDLCLSLDVLSKQIQLLSNEPLSGKSWFLIAAGLIPLSIGIYSIINPIQMLYKIHDKFIEGKFKEIRVPFSLIKELPSTIIREEERKYLQRFSFGNIRFTYENDPFFRKWIRDPQTGNMITITQKDMVENRIARLSPIEKEKIIYHALYSAIKDLKFKAFENIFEILFTITIATGCSFPFFKEAFLSEIKNKKELYNLLKREQTKRFKHLTNY